MYSVFIAYLLWFFGGMGTFGLHRHYLGKHPTGFLWLFTGGLAFIGAAYDFFTIPQQVRDANLRTAIYNAGIRSLQGRGNQVELFPSSGDKVKKPSLEKSILQAARKHQGILTPSQVAVEGDYNLDTCRKELERMTAKGFCEMRVTSAGAVVFRFADFSSDVKADLEL